MSGKTILITGCSSGIGHDAAHGLHRAGWRVFATCRKQADCDRLVGEGLESLVLDLADEGSIQTALAEVLLRTGGRLDALYNNGAFARSEEHTSELQSPTTLFPYTTLFRSAGIGSGG